LPDWSGVVTKLLELNASAWEDARILFHSLHGVLSMAGRY